MWPRCTEGGSVRVRHAMRTAASAPCTRVACKRLTSPWGQECIMRAWFIRRCSWLWSSKKKLPRRKRLRVAWSDDAWRRPKKFRCSSSSGVRLTSGDLACVSARLFPGTARPIRSGRPQRMLSQRRDASVLRRSCACTVVWSACRATTAVLPGFKA